MKFKKKNFKEGKRLISYNLFNILYLLWGVVLLHTESEISGQLQTFSDHFMPLFEQYLVWQNV